MSQRPAPAKISPFMKIANRIPIFLTERGIGGLGKQLVVLETRGRRSGKVYKTPLGPLDEAGDLYLVAARGPATDWYRNALAADTVTITRNGRRSTYHAEALTAADHKRALVDTYLTRFPQVRGQLTQSTGSSDPTVMAERVAILRLRP